MDLTGNSFKQNNILVNVHSTRNMYMYNTVLSHTVIVLYCACTRKSLLEQSVKVLASCYC